MNTRVVARVSRFSNGPVRWPVARAQRRLASDISSTATASTTSPALIGGLAGGGAALLVGYTWYSMSGAKTAIDGISQTKQYISQATEKVKQSAPEPSKALQWLRETAQAYAGFIPGARSYVDTIFNDLDKVHEKHGAEVDRIVSETYDELKRVTQKGASVEAMYEAWAVLERRIQEIMNLAGDAGEDILNNHPQIKEKVGGSLDALKSMGESYGPEAKEQVQKTYEQVRDIFKQGVSPQAIQQAQQVVQEKVDLVKRMGDELWQKGLQQSKQYLDKSPKAKQLVEENQDILKQGNLSSLWAQVRSAADTGSTQQLEDFVQRAKEQVQAKGSSMFEAGGSLSSILASVTGGSEITSTIQKLAEVARSNGKEAEDLLKSTVEEMQEVLKKKAQEAEKIAANASSGKKS